MLELLTPSEMAEADRLAIAGGVSGGELMERAGRAVADEVCRRPAGTAVLILAGSGNNGGDGFVAARILVARGYRVRIALAGDRTSIRGDAAQAAARWTGPVEDAFATSLSSADLLVDALLGAGLSRNVEGPLADLFARINGAGVPVLAVDLPSGIDGATGAVRGVAIRAMETVTFARRKPGHILLPGRRHCGPVRLADIGIDDAIIEAVAPKATLNRPDLWRSVFPKPAIDGHKYGRGHALVLSGGLTATGAARLAARAALRVGAGLVTVASPAEALAIHAAALEAIMVRSMEGPHGLATLLGDTRRNVVVAGPGLDPDEETRRLVETALGARRATVLDAGALTAFADWAERLFDAITESGAPAVLTPHAGEFARLFPTTGEADGKPERARAAARRSGAVIVLKGPDTVVAAPDGRVAIADNAPATLATAGSGDVLAGLVGGLLAQAMPAFEAACAAVFLHGEAARTFGPGLIAEDLPDLLPAALAALDTTL